MPSPEDLGCPPLKPIDYLVRPSTSRTGADFVHNTTAANPSSFKGPDHVVSPTPVAIKSLGSAHAALKCLERLRLHFSDWNENEREEHQDFFAKSRRLYHLTLSFDNGFHAADIPELLETMPASLTELTLDYSDAETFDIGAVLATLRGTAVSVPNLARLELIAPAGGHAFPYPAPIALPTAAAPTPRSAPRSQNSGWALRRAS
ncbi:hypothetical protein DFH09DRAFT_1433608 [Mycena vulgaris]|nr:hypothetical protein DFH09DRAFT_1433608 [Mycena vulgaris]